METSDQALLLGFVQNRSEEDFHQLVNRHLNLVFATARRILGDAHLAEEVAQGVFLLLARKAGEIKAHQPLAGWLYHTTRHQALNTSRSEGRRRQREQTSLAMQVTDTNPDAARITAELEEALEELPAEDRDALVLRFLDNRQLREVGVELGVSEEAARKRVTRALDKLRGIFGKRGVTLSTGVLTTALAGQATAAAPAGLGAAIIASALSGLTATSATAIATTQTTTSLMNLFNLKTAAAILGAAAVTGTTTYLVQEREADRLRADYQTVNETYAKLASDQQESLTMIQLRDDQIAALRKDVADLPRLRGEIDALRRETTKAAELQLSGEEAVRRTTELLDQNTALTTKLNKSLTASWVYERDQWQNRGQAEPLDAFQTFLWAWSSQDREALANTIHIADEEQSSEERARLINQLLPREQPPATQASRIKIFWMTGTGEGEHEEKSLTALEESSFVASPLQTREYLVRWDLVQIDGQWKVVRKRYL